MPPRRKGKKVINKRTLEEEEAKNNDDKIEKGEEEKKDDFVDQEVEKQVAAFRAIREVEIEQMLTSLRLLRSRFTEEQLQTPMLEFLKENLPDLGISKNEENGEIELKKKWKKNEDDGNVDGDGGIDMNYSILRRLSMGFPDRLSLGGYDNGKEVRASLLGTDDDTHFEKFLFQDNQMLPSFDALRTPGQSSVCSDQRMSFGMTPKTRRQPKPGEMMLSVHGSPLGVYQEEDNNNIKNMGAINEEENS